tara:strand:+ start:209 stop:391 length:183 start_codon:yes stop_codon:yes gene_type:complete
MAIALRVAPLHVPHVVVGVVAMAEDIHLRHIPLQEVILEVPVIVLGLVVLALVGQKLVPP